MPGICRWLAALVLLAAPPIAWAAPPPSPVIVFAAASLRNGLDDALAAWQQQTGMKAVADYAGSNTLALQIAQGAPADLFISADRDWMQYLSAKGLTQKASERELLGNRLVLVAPAGSAIQLHIARGFDLAGALGGGRLAICGPGVPAGRYAIAALQSLGAWASVESHTAQADNVRAALALVARGEAPLGVVYSTDAAAEPAVRVVDRLPDDSHPPIVYPVALLHDAQHPAAALLDYLESPAAQAFFLRQGFTAAAH